jgi:hypothetical protein
MDVTGTGTVIPVVRTGTTTDTNVERIVAISTSEKRQRTFYFVCWHTKKMYAAYEKMYAKYKL